MSRPFTNSFARSLYSTPKSSQATPSTATSISKNEQSTPTTPTSQYPSPLPNAAISIEQTPTGKWVHPALAKITQTQSRNAPNDTTIRRVLINSVALFTLYKTSPYIQNSIYLTDPQSRKYLQWALLALCSLLAYNIVESIRRFWWTGSFDDPSLTDSQRKLLNLPASPVNAKRVSTGPALTPPRYQKAFTPSPSSQSSPLSGNAGRRSSFSAHSPSSHHIAGHGTSNLPLDRHSPLQGRSPSSARSVSLLSPKALSESTSPAGSHLDAQARHGPQSGSSRNNVNFAGSTRWKYAQGHTLETSSRVFQG